MVSSSRDSSIDIAKGLLIILVIVGHSGFEGLKFLEWFRMPAFFLISGFFFKPCRDLIQFKSLIRKLILGLFIPYLSFLFILNIFTIYAFISHQEWNNLFHFLLKLGYGGRFTEGINTAVWFVPVLILTRFVVSFISIFFSKSAVVLITSFFFFIGWIESLLFQHFEDNVCFPLNADVVFVSAQYYYLGYLFRDKFINAGFITTVISFAVVSILCLASLYGHVHFHVDLKSSFYPDLIFMSTIPLLSTILLIKTSQLFSKIFLLKRIFTYIGNNTMAILFLHIGVNTLFKKLFGIEAVKVGEMNLYPLLFVVIGTVVPLIFNKIISLSQLTNFLFRGDLTFVKNFKLSYLKWNGGKNPDPPVTKTDNSFIKNYPR